MKHKLKISPLIKDAELRVKPIVIRINKFDEATVAELGDAAKAIGGFGIVVSGVVVDLAGIQRNATVETINPESLRTLAMAMGPGVLLMIGITVVAASFYDLSRAEHSRIRAAITDGG